MKGNKEEVSKKKSNSDLNISTDKIIVIMICVYAFGIFMGYMTKLPLLVTLLVNLTGFAIGLSAIKLFNRG